MNHVKKFKFKVWSLQDAPSMLAQLRYKLFPPGRFLPGGNEEANICLAEMKKPTMLSSISSTAWSCAENPIFFGFLRIKSSEKDFKYLYWRISKIRLWQMFTWKGIYMIDWVGRDMKLQEKDEPQQVVATRLLDSGTQIEFSIRTHSTSH